MYIAILLDQSKCKYTSAYGSMEETLRIIHANKPFKQVIRFSEKYVLMHEERCMITKVYVTSVNVYI